ncbi:MAG TPA: ATP-dependent protease ATPase subunit HslU [Thermotogales bacterium]|nr:ATP-dependent protease ATPase subunit HslU [Thermotogales bacterium]
MEEIERVDDLTPKEIVRRLDKYIVGQERAKKAVAIALRNRIRRQKLPEELRKEILPKNILMIGPTGVGKTEIARRLAQLSKSPFLKVEATRFTEVGYVGKSVDSMIRELVEISVNTVKQEMMKQVEEVAKRNVEERILDAIVPESKRTNIPEGLLGIFQAVDQSRYRQPPVDRKSAESKRKMFKEKLRKGEIEDMEIEIEMEDTTVPAFGIVGGMDLEEIGIDLQNIFGNLMPKRKRKRRMKVSEARRVLLPIEAEKLIDMDKAIQEGLERAQQRGVIFIDEMDKIASKESYGGPDVSREGVQRDLLPIVEGTTIMTKYGAVRTDYILFIAAGAFHISKPSDLIPELQGRFPIRVELDPLTEEDFARILVEPENSITKQYKALLATEGIELIFTDDGVKEMAKMAYSLNQRLENIGARRLYTIVEKVLEDVSFEAPEVDKKKVVIDAEYVRKKLSSIIEDEDLSSYIL